MRFAFLSLMAWMVLSLLPVGPVSADDLTYGEDRYLVGWPTAFEGPFPVGLPPGEGWRAVSRDGSIVTSDCIGDLSTVDCAVDTAMACQYLSLADRDKFLPDDYDWDFPWVDWHSSCDALTYESPGLKYQRRVPFSIYDDVPNRIYYYRNAQFVFSEDTLPKRFDWWASAERGCYRGDELVCFGDVVAPTYIIRCWAPNDAYRLPGDETLYKDHTFTDQTKHCFEYITLGWNLRYNAISAEWDLFSHFIPGDSGSIYRGWPAFESYYDSLR